MLELRIANKFSKHTWDVLFHNVKVLSYNENLYDVVYKNHKFKIEFDSKNPNITYYNFFEKIHLTESLPNSLFTEYAIIIEGEYCKAFEEANNKYNTLFTDNFSENTNYLFSQTIFKWNKIAGIRWFYEFKSIYDNMNHEYRFGYFILRKNKFRISLGNLLSNNDFCFINHFKNEQYNKSIKYTQLNDWIGHYDFDNLLKIHPRPDDFNFDLDYFFRVLPKSKIVLLDETHSDKVNKQKFDWLTEKTYGLILANIPFIPTNYNTLNMIYTIFDIEAYPFEDDIKTISTNPELINNFIIDFNSSFNENYNIIKEWNTKLHNEFMNKIYSENSLFEYFIKKFG